MKRIGKKIWALLIAIVMLCMIGAGPVFADSEKVTVTWIIPSDTGFTLTWPAGESEIVFAPGSSHFNGTHARSQTQATATITVTNNGNTAIKVCGNLTSQCDRGLRFFNCSAGDATNSTASPYWSGNGWGASNCAGDVAAALTNLTANRTICASIASSGGTSSLWFWSSGANMSASAEAADLEYFYMRSYGA